MTDRCVYSGLAVDGLFEGHYFRSLNPRYTIWVENEEGLPDFSLVKESDISNARVVTYLYERRAHKKLNYLGLPVLEEVDGVWKPEKSTC